MKHYKLLLITSFILLFGVGESQAQVSCDNEARISAPLVVAICEDRATGEEFVYLYNIRTSTRTTLASGGDYPSADISRDYVVYGDGDTNNIHYYEIATGTDNVLSGVADSHTLVRVSDDTIFYIGPNSEVISYEISTGTTTIQSAAGEFVQHIAISNQATAYSYSSGGVGYNTIAYNDLTFTTGTYSLLPTHVTMIRDTGIEIDEEVPLWLEHYSGISSATLFLSFSSGSYVGIYPATNEDILYADLSVKNHLRGKLASVVYDSYDSSTKSFSIKLQHMNSLGTVGSARNISVTDPSEVKMMPRISGQNIIWLNETGVGNMKEVRLYNISSGSETTILP